MESWFTTVGPVRGACKHKHRTIATAVECLHRDAVKCRKLGGGAYSDRVIKHADGVSRWPLTEDEAQFAADRAAGRR